MNCLDDRVVLAGLNGAFLMGRDSMARKWSAIAAYNVVFLLLLSFRGTVANADEEVPETTSESGIKGAGHGFEGENYDKADAAMVKFFDEHLKKRLGAK